MKRNFPLWPGLRLHAWTRPALLMALFLASGAALADLQDIDVKNCNNVNITFSLTPGQAVPANTDIEALNSSGKVFWAFSNSGGSTACTGGPLVWSCAGMTVTVPNPELATADKVTITGTADVLGSQGGFTLTATDAVDTTKTCDGRYLLRATSTGGGWGDPHLTTVDGVHYDFQSAGEFTALREPGFELQTRQTPVPSATVPISDPYTGLRSCVSIYTAVAARIGSNRVSLQQNPAGGDSTMLLRVNGALVKLGAQGLVLQSREGNLVRGGSFEGRIDPTTDNGIQITDARGTQLVVKPNFWGAQQPWYLNLNVYNTTATMGTLGRIAPGSWLPALPDGSSLGPKPRSEQQRYNDLYEKFADAWRVTDVTSLFDYAPGTNTATFTRDEWPRDNPQSCEIAGQVPTQPTTAAVAQQACSAVADPAKRANCVFDVSVTGHTGFADGYIAMQRIPVPPSGWQAPLGQGPAGPGGTPGQNWPWWLVILLALIAALVAL